MKKNTYTLYWKTGQRELVSGNNVAEAMTLAGYSNGAVPALEFWMRGDNKEYYWTGHKWEKEKEMGVYSL
jgi:hypothetical protein